MSVFEAFFQGLIQGLTEFLPVSVFHRQQQRNRLCLFHPAARRYADRCMYRILADDRQPDRRSVFSDRRSFFTPLLHTRYASRAAYASVFAVVCLPIVFDGTHQGSHLRVFHGQ